MRDYTMGEPDPQSVAMARLWKATADRLAEENERLKEEIARHGWSVDCSRCAALTDGPDDRVIPDAGDGEPAITLNDGCQIQNDADYVLVCWCGHEWPMHDEAPVPPAVCHDEGRCGCQGWFPVEVRLTDGTIAGGSMDE